MTRKALAALAALAGSAAVAGSIGDLVRDSIASGQPQSGRVDGALGRFIVKQSGRPLMARVRMIERLTGDCARFEARLHLQGASEQLATVEFAMCADGTSPKVR
ncbi:MAG: hypothetical protein OXC81_03580 [Betaproteobacteria bacterium]|nr:hypothetical protein [Betaproteobacteria bacterium]